MPEKVQLFNNLPNDLKKMIGEYLSHEELAHLTSTTKGSRALFNLEAKIHKFIHHVNGRKYNAVQNMLEKESNLVSLAFKKVKMSELECLTEEMEKLIHQYVPQNFNFNDLPFTLKEMIEKYLLTEKSVNLALTTRGHYSLFNPKATDIRKFLYHVVRNDYEAVKTILKKDIHLIAKKGIVTHPSGCIFGNVSGFEYAVFAEQENMQAILRECVPQNKENLLQILDRQACEVKTKGVTYRYEDYRITEHHYSPMMRWIFPRNLIASMASIASTPNEITDEHNYYSDFTCTAGT